MTGLGLPIFDKAIQDANSWVNDVMYQLPWEEKHRAFTLLRSSRTAAPAVKPGGVGQVFRSLG